MTDDPITRDSLSGDGPGGANNGQRSGDGIFSTDAPLNTRRAVVRSLSQARALSQDNVATLYEEARAVVAAGLIGNIALVDPGGRVILNAGVPFGTALPRREDGRGVSGSEPWIGDLSPG